MSAAWKADVIVVVDGDPPAALACLRSVLKFSGASLHRLILIPDATLSPDFGHTLLDLAQADSRVSILHFADSQGCVDACNRGLSQREGDAVTWTYTEGVVASKLALDRLGDYRILREVGRGGVHVGGHGGLDVSQAVRTHAHHGRRKPFGAAQRRPPRSGSQASRAAGVG